MAGLDKNGFTPLTYEEIKTNIESRLEQYNPGFDFSPESPDGQLINIFGVLLSQVWSELGNVYHSYNPNLAVGQGLRNIGMITGLYKGSATRSTCTVELGGTLNTVVPKGSIVLDADNNEFYTNRDAIINATSDTPVTVLAVLSGPIPISAGTITTIKSVVAGWTSVSQAADGDIGKAPQTETAYRNLRNKSVMKGSNSVQESLFGSLRAIGVEQVTVINNDSGAAFAAPDNTPAKSIQVIVGDTTVDSDLIAETIFKNKGMGVPTYGNVSKVVQDIHGYDHTVSFTQATEVPIYVKLEVTYHTEDIAGVDATIKRSISDYLNSLLVGEDVIWSRLFGLITPYGEAEVTLLEIGESAITTAAANITIAGADFASNLEANIDLTSITA